MPFAGSTQSGLAGFSIETDQQRSMTASFAVGLRSQRLDTELCQGNCLRAVPAPLADSRQFARTAQGRQRRAARRLVANHFDVAPRSRARRGACTAALAARFKCRTNMGLPDEFHTLRTTSIRSERRCAARSRIAHRDFEAPADSQRSPGAGIHVRGLARGEGRKNAGRQKTPSRPMHGVWQVCGRMRMCPEGLRARSAGLRVQAS